MDDTTIHDHDDTIDMHYAALGRLELLAILKAPHGTPHGCMNGRVYIGHMVEDPETGGEVESFEAVPCRRCASFR